MAEGEKEQCHICGGMYGVPYIYHHQRKQHGIYGGRTGIKRNDPRYTRQPRPGNSPVRVTSQELVHVAPTTPATAGFRLLEDMKVLIDDEGAIWIAEKVRDA